MEQCSNSRVRRASAFLLLLLASLAFVFAFVPGVSFADDTADTGSTSESATVDPFEYLPLDVVASTDGLPDDQVQITATDTNKLGADVSQHTVSFKVPDGWTLVSGSTSATAATTNDGESVSATAVLAKSSQGGGENENNTPANDTTGNQPGQANGTGGGTASSTAKSPATGDYLALAVLIAIAVAVVALFAAKKLRYRTTLSVLLSVLLVFGLLPTQALRAVADEVGETQAAADDTQSSDDEIVPVISLSKSVNVDVRGESLAIDASVSCSVNVEAAASSIVNLELSNPIPVGASSANVTVLSEVAYTGCYEGTGIKSSFDISKIKLSGSLEGATVRKGAYTTKVDGVNEDDSALKNRTHYELSFIIDDIPEGAASTDSDYGYIELDDQPFADENQGYGVACVSYSDSPGSIAQITFDNPMTGDVNSHTFGSGSYWDGNNRFRIPVDFNGIDVGMPIPAASEFAKYAHGSTFEIDGVKYCTFTEDDIVSSMSVNANVGFKVVECARDLGYTWVTIEVEDATGFDAYKQLTDALAENGLFIGGQVTSSYQNAIVYPEGTDADASGAVSDPFAYAQSSPVAFAWAVKLDRDEQNTNVTYFAGVRSSQEQDSKGEMSFVNVLDTTTFTASKVSTDESGASVDMEADGIAVSVQNEDKSLIKIEVSVPNDQFDSDAELRGLNTADAEDLFDAMYMYLANVNLRMTGGSVNAFGVPEKDADVTIFDGASFDRAESDDAENASLADDATVGVDLSFAAKPDIIQRVSILDRYPTVAAAESAVADESSNDVSKMSNIYRKSANDSQFDSRVKTILSSAVSTGLGINHAINLVKVLGSNLFNYVTAGFTIVGLVGSFVMDLLPQETQMYTVDDVMNKLDEMDAKLDTIDTTVKTINVKLDEQSSRGEWQTKADTYTNLMSLLCSQTTTDIFKGMDNVLGKYNEVDENGNEILDAQGNPTKCSRSTSISNMPEDAVKALDIYLSCIDDNAKNKGFINGIGGAYNALHNVLVVPSTADRTSMLDVYYDYVDTKYNWDVETKAAKRAFLASFMVMYNNAYALYSAKLGVELYKAKGNDAATQGICVSLNDLERYANEVSEVLYGDVDWDGLRSDYPGKSSQSFDGVITATDIDTEKLLKDNPGMTFDEVVQAKYLRVSSYMSEATDTDTGHIKFLATDSTRSRTYDAGSYALTAAYDESCFARAYVTVKDQYVEDAWHPSCSFSMDELRTMVRRLNALPSSMRMTITDSDGNTRPVENIAEEMEAVGFNSQQPNTKFTKTLLNIDTNTMKQREERLIGSRDALWAQNGRTTEVWATVLAGDMNATDEVDRFSDVAWNWNYFFTDFEYNIVYKKKSWNLPRNLTVRQQYAQNLSSSTDRLISSAPIGNRITDPQNYITLSASGLKFYVSEWDSGKGKYGDIFSSQVSLRYGSIFNLKTGDIVENQLLYAFESMDPPLGGIYSMVTGMPSAVRCEYYPFGELNVSTNGKAALMADPAMWYQPNWYSKAITSSNYAGSQNNSIDIRRHHIETD